ncbi:MAG: hypothetical protein KAU47_05935, partial [Candidatus Aminicenantes bacterium]|nr:hypothetical protein [Candidatus Aminicenantes bacterium]
IAGKGHIQYCTITTISESPVTPGVIWVGTDDGKVWVTRNSGAQWHDRTSAIVKAGAPENYWVSRVFASNHEAGTAYVSKSGFRRDDFRPFLYKTTDFGETWTEINGNLPDKPINVIFEDRKNPNLLFLGNDKGVYVSIDGGQSWMYFRNNMPTIAVHDLLVHPRENDLVVGTYGRGLYITNISPFQELNDEVLDKDVHLFQIQPKAQWMPRPWGNYGLYGDRHLSTPNDPNAVVIDYYLKNKVREVKITVTDPSGKVLSRLNGRTEPGINRVLWNMRIQSTEEQPSRVQRRWRRPLADPGEYVVILEVGETTLKGKALIKKRAGWSVGPYPAIIK